VGHNPDVARLFEWKLTGHFLRCLVSCWRGAVRQPECACERL
jgi:hypothetical protein